MMKTSTEELEKEVKRLKRVAMERAGILHDLVEERLPAAYEELPSIAQSVYEACKAWAEAQDKLKSMV
ncbi:MAG: CCE_0567 family metalloprotein [Rhodocyclaceae bacterium]|nr:CCE_0567 family metalloprotein [Rhodocyclaceae bacterium]